MIEGEALRTYLPVITSPVTDSLNKFILGLIYYLINNVLPRLWDLIKAPFTEPSVMWIITPLMISMVLMQLYFGRHREEELGWNTAFGNSIALIFVSLNLLQLLFNKHGYQLINIFNLPTQKIWLVIGLASISVTQLLINYFHAISKKIAFFINSSISTNTTAYLAIILVYTAIPMDISTLIASIILLVLMFYLFEYLRSFVPMTVRASKYMEQRKLKIIKKKLWIEKMELRKSRAADAVFRDSIFMFFAVLLSMTALILIEIFLDNKLIHYYAPLVLGSLFMIITIIYLIKRKLSLKNLNLDGGVREFIIGLLFGLVIITVYGLINLLLTLFINSSIYYYKYDAPSLVMLLIGNVIVLPLGSELLFRGAIHRSLKAKLTKKHAIVMQAVMYSIITLRLNIINNPILYLSLVPVVITAIIMGFIRERWGLECAISAHFSTNLIGVLVWLFIP